MFQTFIILWHVGTLLSDSSVNAWIAQQWVGVTWPLRFRKWRHIHPHLVGCHATLGKHSSMLGCYDPQQWSEVHFPLVQLWVYRRNWNSYGGSFWSEFAQLVTSNERNSSDGITSVYLSVFKCMQRHSSSVVSHKWRKQAKWNQEEYGRSACEDIKTERRLCVW
jgi:hypothetical protein